MSLRNRIALFYALTTGLLAALFFLVLYIVMYRTVYGHMDDDLEAESLDVFNGMVVFSDEIIFTNPAEWTEREHGQVEVNPVFVQVVDSIGRVMRKTPNLRETGLGSRLRLTESSIIDTLLQGAPIRRLQLPVTNPTGHILGYVVVALPSKEAEIILLNLRLVLYVAFPTVLILVFAVSRAIAQRSIAPIGSITATAERITSETLEERIALPGTKDELFRLASTINRLLDRLQEALLHERRFTADASHELRTPLAALKGTLEVLTRKPRTPEHYAQKIAGSIREVDRLSSLVDQLLLLARSDNGRMMPDLGPVDLSSTFDSVIGRMEPILASRSIAVDSPRGGPVDVRADRMMLEMILENLVSNAVKYSPVGSTISVSYHETPDRVMLTITDRGLGIEEENLPRIFDRFYRVDEARNPEVQGAGLGLAIVKRLADLQGLTLEIRSMVLQGTSVSVIFPKTAGEA